MTHKPSTARPNIIFIVADDLGHRSTIAETVRRVVSLVPSLTEAIDATDPRSGTAEFKAAAIRIDKLSTPA